MKEKLIQFIKEHQLFNQEDKILLTVSGGIDSMTLLHLFNSCGFNMAVAHCNFGLRGAESDGDEEFVSRNAQNLGVPIHINRFDTLKYSEERKISIQMAARELRYRWFERLAKENDYKKIATAHNANDVVETFLINLTRGTGINGLTGINVSNNDIIRPMLFASREEIEKYVEENKLVYREDSSNAETKYLRNAIRHKIIPEFENLNTSFRKNMLHTTNILKEAETIYNRQIEELKKLIITEKGDLKYFGIATILSNKVSPTLLYEVIAPYGFTFDTAERMIENISNQSGAIYYSDNHKMVKDRTSYILYPLIKNEHVEYLIEKDQKDFDAEIALEIKNLKVDKNFELKRNKEIGTFDASKLKYPLKLRRWQYGDYFYPFGMRGKKKVSDYFSDQKVSIPEKESTWILCSGDDIIWILNHRTDNRFCVTNTTEEVVQIEVKS